jgi:hypothetical protein
VLNTKSSLKEARIQCLQVLMGHAEISTTSRYLETQKEERALAKMRALDWGFSQGSLIGLLDGAGTEAS